MIKNTDAYTIASHIHDSFLGINDILSEEELAHSEVAVTIGSTSSKTSQRIETEGNLNGEQVRQVLALDKRDMYHLSTLELKDRGKLTQAHIGTQSPLENLEILAGSLFMHKLVEIAHAHRY
ncbi:hypothetical protein KY385_04705 [Candidatus Parcubacteria bacterium]|nr:hypothetical protein [Candidatus Parcubacteria bacterium]